MLAEPLPLAILDAHDDHVRPRSTTFDHDHDNETTKTTKTTSTATTRATRTTMTTTTTTTTTTTLAVGSATNRLQLGTFAKRSVYADLMQERRAGSADSW